MSLIRLMFIAFRYLQNRYADRIALNGVCHAHEMCGHAKFTIRRKPNRGSVWTEEKKIRQMLEDFESFDSVNQMA